MISKTLLLLFLLNLALTTTFTQSLSTERIVKIKNCTVRITIEGIPSVGSGFFVANNGSVLTCWHVVEPALIKDSLQRIIGLRKIYIQLSSGEKIEMGFAAYFLQKGITEAIAYDFCLLNMITPQKSPFLKIGDFNKVQEGQDVYTCGFPIGITQPFISKGIISTKYLDTLNSVTVKGKSIKMPRMQALLDLTLNSGNSGGAIVKLGNTIDDDEVIGLADFIVNPIGSNNANDLIKLFSKGVGKYNLEGVDPSAAFIYFTQILSAMSLGVSGCISTNHFLTSLNNIGN